MTDTTTDARVTIVTHGSSGYKRGCRCKECRSANAANNRKYRARRLASGSIPPTVKHGASAYANWGCRCKVCVAAATAAGKPATKRYLDSHPDVKKRLARNSHARRQARSLETATRWGYQWTGPELELASRDDLTVPQIAQMTRRTVSAVKTIRTKLRKDPKIINLAGLR